MEKADGVHGQLQRDQLRARAATFFGNYISQDAVKKIADDFYLITAALELVNIPLSIYVPYTKPWRGKRISNAVLAELTKCAAASKAHYGHRRRANLHC